ncbi:hypothetical protein [Bibersteinia trehalosi]|uniref:hypothetical protein n=1 Tax=Bibersteinia trehalosi TaxID=47735 RepID=UPI002D76BF06|nr:hypothetical protein [Bibersteinia trehalosi]
MADEPQHQITPHRQNTGGKMGFISDLLTTINIGGKMSEQRAGKAGLTISQGLHFFFKAIGTGVMIAMALLGGIYQRTTARITRGRNARTYTETK